MPGAPVFDATVTASMLDRRSAPIAVLLVLLSALAPTAAEAEAPASSAEAGENAQRVAVIHIGLQGDYAPGLADEIDQAVTAALGEIGFAPISYNEVRERIESRLGSMPSLADCIATDCLNEMPKLLGTNLFVRVRVEASSAIYSFEVLFLSADGEASGVRERSKGSCPVCTPDEFIERVSESVRTLMEPLQPVSVVIASRPAGATLTVNGTEAGAAPFSGRLAPGPHEVRASLPGHADAVTTVRVAPGQPSTTQSFEVSLTPEAVADGPSESGGSFGMWKWSAAAASAVSVGLGVTWLAVDGSQSCDLADGQTQCPKLYDTRTQGFAALGVGAALGALAVWMFTSEGDATSETAEGSASLRPGFTPLAGGALGSVQLRF